METTIDGTIEIGETPSTDNRPDNENYELEGTILIIMGGTTSGEIVTTRKQYARTILVTATPKTNENSELAGIILIIMG